MSLVTEVLKNKLAQEQSKSSREISTSSKPKDTITDIQPNSKIEGNTAVSNDSKQSNNGLHVVTTEESDDTDIIETPIVESSLGEFDSWILQLQNFEIDCDRDPILKTFRKSFNKFFTNYLKNCDDLKKECSERIENTVGVHEARTTPPSVLRLKIPIIVNLGLKKVSDTLLQSIEMLNNEALTSRDINNHIMSFFKKSDYIPSMSKQLAIGFVALIQENVKNNTLSWTQQSTLEFSKKMAKLCCLIVIGSNPNDKRYIKHIIFDEVEKSAIIGNFLLEKTINEKIIREKKLSEKNVIDKSNKNQSSLKAYELTVTRSQTSTPSVQSPAITPVVSPQSSKLTAPIFSLGVSSTTPTKKATTGTLRNTSNNLQLRDLEEDPPKKSAWCCFC